MLILAQISQEINKSGSSSRSTYSHDTGLQVLPEIKISGFTGAYIFIL